MTARVTTKTGIRVVCCLAAWFICWGNAGQALALPRMIDYLYVEANEGDSSGGHAAIRFEERTYHFQHDNHGTIRIRSLDSALFDHSYATLGNRTIHASGISVSEETYQLLRDAFDRFSIIQEAQLGILDTLRRDVELFEFLIKQARNRNSGEDTGGLPLKGLGYFLPDGSAYPEIPPSPDSPPSPALIKLRQRISMAYGEHFIAERIGQARAALQEIDLRASQLPAAEFSRNAYPQVITSASSRYEEALLARYALEILQNAPALRPDSFWTSESSSFIIDAEEQRFLSAVADQLQIDLVRLVTSSRSDWAFPFIAGMARLAALEASLSSERLVLLDIYPNSAQLQERQPAAGSSYLPEMKNEAERDFLRRRSEFFNSMEIMESDYAALEQAGNLLAERERALANGTQPRRLPQPPLPHRTAWRNDVPLPDMSEALLQKQREAARAAEDGYAGALSRLYSYSLFRRNCVTEIFSTINSALERQASSTEEGVRTARDESLQRLGGFVDASRGLTFVPFVSSAAVDACYAVTNRQKLPSYRARKLAEMKKRESPLWVFLRESSTTTSTIYRPAPGDSPFLFFTDDTILLRPLFGAFNLLAGIGKSLLGLAVMPLEGTKQLHLGVKGILFSLPELAFVNLRKGSMEYVGEKR